MEFGICLLSIMPVRKEPYDNSEMVTQILFGELVVISEEKGSWLKVRIVFDGYEGWVDHKQINLIDETEFARLNSLIPSYSLDLVNVVRQNKTNTLIPIVIGSSIRFSRNHHFSIGENTYEFEGDTTIQDSLISPSVIIENAMMYLNSPYLWGGKSPFGIDCSGLTQNVFKISRIKLHRDSARQATQGETISFITEAKPADLLFFGNEEGSVTHVGIYIGQQQIIHSSGRVRIDSVDHNGIFNKDSNTYSHKLRLIKKIL